MGRKRITRQRRGRLECARPVVDFADDPPLPDKAPPAAVTPQPAAPIAAVEPTSNKAPPPAEPLSREALRAARNAAVVRLVAAGKVPGKGKMLEGKRYTWLDFERDCAAECGVPQTTRGFDQRTLQPLVAEALKNQGK